MAWWLSIAVIGLAGFFFNGDIARHVPFTELAIRQTMIGGLFGLAAGFAIHAFERVR